MFYTEGWTDYTILDTGDGEKLERWGRYLLRRPDPQVIWPKRDPETWRCADAVYHRSTHGGGSWEFITKLPDQWEIRFDDMRFSVHPTGFKHTGLFPEQACNWQWMRTLIREREKAGKTTEVLNLFAYTGGATLACAGAGASVCHVDAAKSMIQWAHRNYDLSGYPATSVRWIADDALKFVAREIRRGRRYDGIVMDPPSYGRGTGGEVWKLEDRVFELMKECAKLLSDDPAFFLINSYTTGLQPAVLGNLLSYTLGIQFGGKSDAGEICLPVVTGGVLPCGASGRWMP